jgi:hypothetical protein
MLIVTNCNDKVALSIVTATASTCHVDNVGDPPQAQEEGFTYIQQRAVAINIAFLLYDNHYFDPILLGGLMVCASQDGVDSPSTDSLSHLSLSRLLWLAGHLSVSSLKV